MNRDPSEVACFEIIHFHVYLDVHPVQPLFLATRTIPFHLSSHHKVLKYG